MKRIELDMPDEFPYTTELPVRVDDVNYEGHLGNDRVLTLTHEARIRFLKANGYTEMDVGGPGLIQANAEIQYKTEGDLGDVLLVQVAPDEISSMGLDIYVQFQKQDTDQIVANVRTGMVGFDTEKETPVRLPEHFVETMEDVIET